MAKKKYNLIGVDGNAYAIMGYVAKAMKESGFTKEEITKYYDDCRSADYNHLVMASHSMVEKCNKK